MNDIQDARPETLDELMQKEEVAREKLEAADMAAAEALSALRAFWRAVSDVRTELRRQGFPVADELERR